MSESFRCLLANSKWALKCLSHGLATLPYRSDWCCAAEMVVLLEGSPISTEELWSSVRVIIGLLVTSLTKALLPRFLSFSQVASSRKSLGGSKHLPFKNDGGHCVLQEPSMLQTLFWFPSPDLCLDTVLSRSSKDNSFDLMARFLL